MRFKVTEKSYRPGRPRILGYVDAPNLMDARERARAHWPHADRRLEAIGHDAELTSKQRRRLKTARPRKPRSTEPPLEIERRTRPTEISLAMLQMGGKVTIEYGGGKYPRITVYEGPRFRALLVEERGRNQRLYLAIEPSALQTLVDHGYSDPIDHEEPLADGSQVDEAPAPELPPGLPPKPELRVLDGGSDDVGTSS